MVFQEEKPKCERSDASALTAELLPQVLSVGVSALLMQILTLVQQTVIYRVASNYGGETSQLLLGAALRFWNFSFVPLWGISQGFQPAAGTNYGAKDYDRVKTLTKVFIIAATLLSLVFYIPAELFPEKILSMFLTTPGIAASGATNFRIMFSTYVLQGSFYDCRNSVPVFGQGEIRRPGWCCSVRLFCLSRFAWFCR